VVAELARDHDAELVLLQALPSQGSNEANAKVQQKAEDYLSRMAQKRRVRVLPAVRWSVWYDEPSQAIADAAAANEVDLIAMATHGRGGLSRLLLGSVAESVVRRAPAPVLLIRGQPSWSPGVIGKILVPLDGSELSEGILPIVERLARPFDLAISLVRAIEPLPPSTMAGVVIHVEESTRLRTAEAQEYLSKVAAGFEAKGLRVTCAVRLGPAVNVIQERAREAEADLIAMATHGRTGLGRLFLGSVAERVLRAAEVPILLWKPGLTVRGVDTVHGEPPRGRPRRAPRSFAGSPAITGLTRRNSATSRDIGGQDSTQRRRSAGLCRVDGAVTPHLDSAAPPAQHTRRTGRPQSPGKAPRDDVPRRPAPWHRYCSERPTRGVCSMAHPAQAAGAG